MTIFSKPSGYTCKIPFNILRRSLKAGDLSQNPKVSFLHKGKILAYKLLGF